MVACIQYIPCYGKYPKHQVMIMEQSRFGFAEEQKELGSGTKTTGYIQKQNQAHKLQYLQNRNLDLCAHT